MLHCDPEVGWVGRPSIWSCCQFSHTYGELAVIPCFFLATLLDERQGEDPLALWGATNMAAQSSPSTQANVSKSDCSCMQRWPCLPAGWAKGEKEEKDKDIRDSAVSLRATCCLLGVHCRYPQPVQTHHHSNTGFLWPCRFQLYKIGHWVSQVKDRRAGCSWNLYLKRNFFHTGYPKESLEMSSYTKQKQHCGPLNNFH